MVLLFKFLHVATMFTAITLSLGPAVLIRVVARTGNARSIQAVADGSAKVGRALGPVFILGLIFGLTTAALGGFSFTAPWLLIAYVLFAAGLVVGAGGEGPWTAEVARAAAANAETGAGPALLGVVRSRKANGLLAAFVVIVTALIFDMVVKPFS